ncbi:hypothetical protein JOB18_020574, partial [Solea senegalensis]
LTGCVGHEHRDCVVSAETHREWSATKTWLRSPNPAPAPLGRTSQKPEAFARWIWER